ncbi:WD repeat, SAM and U-box domain-containing protein 1 [Eumeta japonica]|uniref:WD repeat, SAM and U-box domain-containing protein 1 n=1 Tax=Eumeta variegata TaxID=151549 RepID=A0A4C1WR73_EUMVA|nr:WD repeat, SAM and U-box domain-containing protein 1 [Eumeta japonica]
MSEEPILLQALRVHRSEVNCVDTCRDRLATVSSDKTVRVWQWEVDLGFVEVEGSPARGHKYGVVCVRYSPQGLLLASCSIDGTTRVWCARSLRAARVLLQPGGSGVRALCWTGEARRLLTGADDGSLCVWDVPGGRLLRCINAHEGSVRALGTTAGGALLLSACTLGVLKLHRLHVINGDEDECEKRDGDNVEVQVIHSLDDTHDLGVLCADMGGARYSDGEWHAALATGGQDGRVRVWMVVWGGAAGKGELRERSMLDGHTSAVTDVRWAPMADGDNERRWMASASLDRSVRLWVVRATSAACARVLDAHPRYVTSVAFGGAARLLMTASNDRSVRIWSVAGINESEGAKLDTPLRTPCTLLAHFGAGDLEGIGPVFEQDEDAIPVTEDSGLLGTKRIWTDREVHGGAVNGVALHEGADMQLLATACSDRAVRVFLWMDTALQLLHKLEAHRYPATAVDFSAGGTALLSASLDGQALLWEPEGGSRLLSLRTDTVGGAGGGGVRCARQSPMRSVALALVATDDHIASLWELEESSSEPLHVYEGHSDAVLCCAWTPSGEAVVTGCADGELRLFAAPPAFALLHTERHAHDLGVYCCDTVQDGERALLASGGCDSVVRLWLLRSKWVYIIIVSNAKSERLSMLISGKELEVEGGTENNLSLLHELQGHGGTVTGCRFAARASVLATTATDKHVRVWSSSSGECVWAASAPAAAASCVLWADAGFVAAGFLDGELSVWEVGTQQHEEAGTAEKLPVEALAHWTEHDVARWLLRCTGGPSKTVSAQDAAAWAAARARARHLGGALLATAPLSVVLQEMGLRHEANMEPGPLNHSRWLTTANRILRLYITKTDPDEKLVILATLSRYLKLDMKKIVDNVIQRNGYFGHPENVLVAMLGDDMESIRELAYQQILTARSETAPGIRTFKVPALNFDAEDYTQIITWQDLKITEPPLTSKLSDEALKSIVKSGLGTILKVKKYPCHTQAVERCIKLVTEASSAVCGEHKRDGFIRARLLSHEPGEESWQEGGVSAEGRAALVEELRWLRCRHEFAVSRIHPLQWDNDHERYFDFPQEHSETQEVPHAFLCPLTHRLMLNPVKCPDGFTYERAALEEWLMAAGAAVSPVSGRLLAPAAPRPHSPNRRLQQAVRELLLPPESN